MNNDGGSPRPSKVRKLEPEEAKSSPPNTEESLLKNLSGFWKILTFSSPGYSEKSIYISKPIDNSFEWGHRRMQQRGRLGVDESSGDTWRIVGDRLQYRSEKKEARDFVLDSRGRLHIVVSRGNTVLCEKIYKRIERKVMRFDRPNTKDFVVIVHRIRPQ